MAKTLIIKSSIPGANSVSSSMADTFAASVAAKDPNGAITLRDGHDR